MNSSHTSKRNELAIAIAVYTAATVAYTWPLVLHPRSRLAAPVGPGDPYLYIWVFGWVIGTILRAPLNLLNGRVFNANIFYPAESTLAYSDHMILQSVVLTPLYALTGDLVLCYNVLLFASMLASALAMHAFVRAVTGSAAGAYLAGLAWAFWPYRFAHLVHIQLQALYFLPLAFLFLHRLMAGRRRRDAVALGAVMGLQTISTVYYGLIAAIGIAVGAVALAIGIGRWRSSIVARRLILAAVVGALIAAPIVWVYWRVQRDAGFGRSLYEASRNAASLDSYLRVPAGNVLYGRTGLLPSGMLERALFPGFVVLALATFGVVKGRRSDARPLVVAMLAVGVLAFVLSLGPDGMRPLYSWFQQHVFGFQAIRAPARFAVLVMFALASLAALGVRELSLSRRSTYLYVAVVLSAMEWLNVPMPLAAAPPRETPVGQWLQHEPGPGAVVYLPMAEDAANTPAMIQSLEHRRPLINGYSGLRPEFYNALADSLATFPSPDALLALNESGARFIVMPGPVDPPNADLPWPLVERARLADGVIYELRWTPEIEARLAADTTATPPPPGRAPFAPGETARYSAFWGSAGVNLSAGEITVTVEPPPYTFVAKADTAPWMARFFEAHDTFTTRADPQLLPQVHERDQNEGSRKARRTFLFRHSERLVKIGRDAVHATGEEGLSLPLAAFARDALTAMFYVRTLPLASGDTYLIPVNEAGRSLLVELRVAGREPVLVQGKQIAAVRLTPVLRRRVERRRPVNAVLWLSDDDRKVPLAMDVDAAFGHVRLELVSYAR